MKAGQKQWARNEEVLPALPEDLRELAVEHERKMRAVLDAVVKTLAAAGEPGPLIHESSVRLNIESERVYKNDGNTQTPATRYTVVWLYELCHKKKDEWRNEFNNWASNRLECAIAHSMEVVVRDLDDHFYRGSWSLYFGGRSLGLDDKQSERVCYGGTSGENPRSTIPCIHSQKVVNLVERVIEMRRRLKLLSFAEELAPKDANGHELGFGFMTRDA